jgi:hypothetical protein
LHSTRLDHERICKRPGTSSFCLIGTPRYSGWVPSMREHAADSVNEASGQSLLLTYC